ncbi:Asp-tRNA(Asn)/Glu-tRNA(Gln) amidotransferase subunit GatC [Patescibacteria group bacterium]|nr:Asp-tRNA(Asn)/Glu-tRNA(Gln) amidotransferase subunit GatC [Patescibacteria group bacterium]
MKLTKEQVEHLAKLSRLTLQDNVLEQMTKDVGSILEYVESIQKVNIQNIEPFAMPAVANGFRNDEAFACDELTRELILENFPGRTGDLLAAPGVFEKPKN